jgi:hypothetical protein
MAMTVNTRIASGTPMIAAHSRILRTRGLGGIAAASLRSLFTLSVQLIVVVVMSAPSDQEWKFGMSPDFIALSAHLLLGHHITRGPGRLADFRLLFSSNHRNR